MQSLFFRDPVHFLRQRKRIDAVNHFEQRQGVPDLVFLEMSDEMPAQIRRQLRNFGAGFLNAAFAEQSLPGFNRLAHFLGWMRLRDRDQLNVIN